MARAQDKKDQAPEKPTEGAPAGQSAIDALADALASRLGPGMAQGATIADARGGGAAISPRDDAAEFSADDRLARRNANGGMLKYRVAFAMRKDTKFNRFSGVINDYRYSYERGKVIEVPWFVVDFWRNNNDTQFFQSKDEQGQNIVVRSESPAETMTMCQPIDPLPGFEDGEHLDVTIARWKAIQASKVAA